MSNIFWFCKKFWIAHHLLYLEIQYNSFWNSDPSYPPPAPLIVKLQNSLTQVIQALDVMVIANQSVKATPRKNTVIGLRIKPQIQIICEVELSDGMYRLNWLS